LEKNESGVGRVRKLYNLHRSFNGKHSEKLEYLTNKNRIKGKKG